MNEINIASLQSSATRSVLMTATILLIPLIAMSFISEVNWTAGDFAIAAILIFSVSMIFNVYIKNIRPSRNRFIAGLILFIAFALLWGELAVGIFGSPIAGS